jgi:hypothetical protein
MLTVKHVAIGYETTISTESVTFYESGLHEGDQVTHGRFVRAWGTPRNEAGEAFRDFFQGGHVYVMNDNGKTVGSYDVTGSYREMMPREA